ncbi:biotin/lipoyl-containing protein [Opitutus sp. GAS368]|uniref:biotin/lipoyl-containing protein n=1 Tax=Opitutus sp. GAS368 TaxID=1882749 RepID=UPI00087A4D48|nr:biotin/lipoyl-containing protein [Opitutus sp. GAS368]SDR71871.1 e3 binding domain-containing protein [Opitutus sp. GAS368]
MSTFIIDVPVPSMGATVSELTVINLAVTPGTKVTKGQKLAALESDKSAFDFESPVEGTVLAIMAKNGAAITSGQPFLRMETSDESLRHLAVRMTDDGGRRTENGEQKTDRTGPGSPPSSVVRSLIWTPRATKMAQEAGLDPATITDIEATGPGGRVSGDDVTKYLAGRK